MATVERVRISGVTGKKVKVWAVDFRVTLPNGEQKRIQKDSPVQTKRGPGGFENQLRAELLRGTHRQQAPAETVSFECFADEFLENHASLRNKPSEIASKKTILRRHLLPAFGTLRLDKISPDLVEAFAARQAKSLSAKTVNNQLTVLRKMLTVASRKGLRAAPTAFSWLRTEKPGSAT